MAVHTTVVKGSASAVIDKLAVAKPSFKQPSVKPLKLEAIKAPEKFFNLEPSAKPFKLEYTKPSFKPLKPELITATEKPLNMAVEAVIIVDVFKSETEDEFVFNIKKSAFFKNGPPILSHRKSNSAMLFFNQYLVVQPSYNFKVVALVDSIVLGENIIIANTKLTEKYDTKGLVRYLQHNYLEANPNKIYVARNKNRD